jgi:hypothetical protein
MSLSIVLEDLPLELGREGAAGVGKFIGATGERPLLLSLKTPW